MWINEEKWGTLETPDIEYSYREENTLNGKKKERDGEILVKIVIIASLQIKLRAVKFHWRVLLATLNRNVESIFLSIEREEIFHGNPHDIREKCFDRYYLHARRRSKKNSLTRSLFLCYVCARPKQELAKRSMKNF